MGPLRGQSVVGTPMMSSNITRTYLEEQQIHPLLRSEMSVYRIINITADLPRFAIECFKQEVCRANKDCWREF